MQGRSRSSERGAGTYTVACYADHAAPRSRQSYSRATSYSTHADADLWKVRTCWSRAGAATEAKGGRTLASATQTSPVLPYAHAGHALHPTPTPLSVRMDAEPYHAPAHVLLRGCVQCATPARRRCVRTRGCRATTEILLNAHVGHELHPYADAKRAYRVPSRTNTQAQKTQPKPQTIYIEDC